MIWLLAGVTGLAAGSFLNVCVHRLPAGESVVAPRSRCPECRAPIGWRDNIPVLSWILLRGRCRGCGAGISLRYPLVESAAAAIWMAVAVRHGSSPETLRAAVFLTILLGIALTDARSYLIPDEFSLGGAALGVALALAPGGVTPLQSIVGAGVGFGMLWLAGVLGEVWLRQPAMGGGDVKMMLMVGSFLGPLGALLTIFVGALAGVAVFLPISLKSRRLVPFGVFLAFGATAALLWGEQIAAWYVDAWW